MKGILSMGKAGLSAAALMGFSMSSAFAEDGMDKADTAWILTSTALVLFMTLPGLALFYGGLVRQKNFLSVLMHCFAIACVASIVWAVIGYSLAFSEGWAWVGGFDRVMLSGMTVDSLSGNLPESVFMMFQMTFAIITPALIVGAFPERIKFAPVVLFTIAWLILVYAPVVHWIWGGGAFADAEGSWLYDIAGAGVKDFAGGIVVHLTAGISALVIAVMLGRRAGFPDEVSRPHSSGLTMAGAAMLWVGWYGFNGGSALAAGGEAGMAITVTHLSAAAASITWALIEWVKQGKPTLIGIVTGMVAGLATVTPASGFIGPEGGLVCGIAGGALCYFAVQFIKFRLHIDDSLDVFAVHGVGGILGSILVSFYAAESMGGLVANHDMMAQLKAQVIAIVITAVYSIVVTYVVMKALSFITGLRVTIDDESEGLDITAHGERAYDH